MNPKSPAPAPVNPKSPAPAPVSAEAQAKRRKVDSTDMVKCMERSLSMATDAEHKIVLNWLLKVEVTRRDVCNDIGNRLLSAEDAHVIYGYISDLSAVLHDATTKRNKYDTLVRKCVVACNVTLSELVCHLIKCK